MTDSTHDPIRGLDSLDARPKRWRVLVVEHVVMLSCVIADTLADIFDVTNLTELITTISAVTAMRGNEKE